MNRVLKIASILGFFTSLMNTTAVFAMGEDDPLLAKVTVHQLEWRDGKEETPFVWDLEAWIGKDLQKLWLVWEGERESGETEASEVQALYSHAVSPYWDFQVGWRGDFEPSPDRHWLAVGFRGLAHYFIDTDLLWFIRDGGQHGFRLEAEKEVLITQKIILVPEIEVSLHTTDDEKVGIGSGLSDIELGLRLQYAVTKRIAPYIGVNWEKSYGDTAEFARDEGEHTEDFQWLIGVHGWF